MRQISCDVFAPSVDVLINSLTVARDAQFVIELKQSVPERVTDEVVNSCLRFLLKCCAANFGEITESSLTRQLRKMEADGFLTRHNFKEIPPRWNMSCLI